MSGKKRKYETSHPWLTFELDLSNAPYTLWLLLGAAESKCRHMAGIPLRPEKREELNRVSMVKGVHATTAIEGNTLSEEDVSQISSDNADIPTSRDYQRQEIQNMLDAYNAVIDSIKDGADDVLTVDTLRKDNATILRGLTLKDGASAGEIRTYPVVVLLSNYRGAPAEDCEHLLDRLLSWLASDWGLSKEHPLVEGILKAVTAHLYFTWIHPFGDGNGRGARLLEFRLLMRIGAPLTAAHLLTSYYNNTRSMYYYRLALTSKSDRGRPLEFILYALQGFVDALDRQISSILEEQLNVTWENFVHENVFGGKLTDILRRRRDLLIDISALGQPVAIEDMRLRLSKALLRQYQGKTTRTLTRDLAYLEHRGLIHKTENGYAASKELMKAFLPLRNV